MALIGAISTIGSYTMGSRVLGFVRDILVAAMLGAGPVADAFFVAFKLPNLFRRLFAEGATLDTAEIYFHWSAPTTVAFGFSFIPSFVLQALGRAVLPMISGAFRIASLAALVYLLVPAYDLGPEVVFGAATLSAFVEGFVSLEFLRRQLRAMPTGPSDQQPEAAPA